jgi:CBS domain-containing protein
MTLSRTNLHVGDLMTIDPIAIDADASVLDAERLLTAYCITGLPVTHGDVACGVISQTDLLHARSSALIGPNWDRLKVRHLMTSPAVTVHANTSVQHAARLMIERHIHRLVVVGDDETPVGVVTTSDLVKVLFDDYGVEYS